MEDLIETLQKLNNAIPFSVVKDWANETDLDYTEMSDLEMYIEYLKVNKI